jgi:hypothetical protein
MKSYFDWTFREDATDRRQLAEPKLKSGAVVDAWRFKACERMLLPEPLVASIIERGSGAELEFGAFELPIVGRKLGMELERRFGDQVQLLPIEIEHTRELKFVLNALISLNCINEERSEFTKWEIGNDMRPDKVGQYRSISSLWISADRCNNKDFIRPWGWRVALIVSDVVVNLVSEIAPGESCFIPVS